MRSRWKAKCGPASTASSVKCGTALSGGVKAKSMWLSSPNASTVMPT